MRLIQKRPAIQEDELDRDHFATFVVGGELDDLLSVRALLSYAPSGSNDLEAKSLWRGHRDALLLEPDRSHHTCRVS